MKAIPVKREELKNVLDSLELDDHSWDALNRARENVQILIQTLLRRRQKEFSK